MKLGIAVEGVKGQDEVGDSSGRGKRSGRMKLEIVVEGEEGKHTWLHILYTLNKEFQR